MLLAEPRAGQGERLSCGFTQPGGQRAQEPAELPAAIHVRRGCDDADAAPAPAKAFRKPGEHVGAPRGNAAQEIQVLGRQADERNSAVGRGSEDGIRSPFEKLECFFQSVRRRRHVATNEKKMSTEGSRLPCCILETLAERASALLENEKMGDGQPSPPLGMIRSRRGDDQPRATFPGGFEPARCEGRKELLAGRPVKAFFACFAPGLPREENEETLRHPRHLTMGRSERVVFRKCYGR